MSRIDIVVFPNGAYEIFGQIDSVGYEFVSSKIDAFMRDLPPSNNSRKFTGYYDELDAGDIEWEAYNEENPIVLVEQRSELEQGEEISYESIELAQVPVEHRGKYFK